MNRPVHQPQTARIQNRRRKIGIIWLYYENSNVEVWSKLAFEFGGGQVRKADFDLGISRVTKIHIEFDVLGASIFGLFIKSKLRRCRFF